MSALPTPLRRPARIGRPARDRPERPHLRVVHEPPRRHTVLFALLALLLAGGTIFATVSLNALAAGDAVRARELERQVVAAERAYGQLVAEVARLENPERVRRAALELGMVPADAPRLLTVQRRLPVDGTDRDAVVVAGETADPMKPVLSVER